MTPARSTAHLRYDAVNLEEAGALTTLVSSPFTSGQLELNIKRGEQKWMLGTRQIPANESPHVWHEVTWPLPADVVGAQDVRMDVTLTAPVQLAEIRTVPAASAGRPDGADDESTRSGTR